MNKKFHNSRGSSTHARYQNPRWQIVLIALLLVLTLSGAAQPPPPSFIRVYMDVVNPKTTVCVGETVQYSVKVLVDTEALADHPWALPEVEITGISSNEIIGHFTRDTARTGPETQDVAKAASFSFVGGKPGKIDLTFKASVFVGFEGGHSSDRDVSNPPLHVKVIYCKYKVQVTSKWSAGMTSVATTDTAVITADEEGSFRGSFGVTWVTSILCSLKSPIAPSTANLTGLINEKGKLDLTITYGSAISFGGGTCRGSSTTTSNFARPAELKITAEPSGGLYPELQKVETKEASYTGLAKVTVTPLAGAR